MAVLALSPRFSNYFATVDIGFDVEKRKEKEIHSGAHTERNHCYICPYLVVSCLD